MPKRLSDKKVDETKHEKKRFLQSILNFGKSSKRSKASPDIVKNAVGSSQSRTSNFGNIDEFCFGLANFKCEDLLKTSNGLPKDFTLQKYVNEAKMKRVLLCITTKKIDIENEELSSEAIAMLAFLCHLN